jgi:hypothetical protein
MSELARKMHGKLSLRKNFTSLMEHPEPASGEARAGCATGRENYNRKGFRLSAKNLLRRHKSVRSGKFA